MFDEAAIRESFARQAAMSTIGAELGRIEPGLVEIRLTQYSRFTQQHGYLHAGIATALVDTACGYAALTMAREATNVLTIEYKVNFLSPAVGVSFVAQGRVKKAGRTLTVCEGDVLALDEQGGSKVVATMLATMMMLAS